VKPARRLRARLARVREAGDRGASVVELAVLAPGLMMLCMLILQFGLWFNAREAALASAQAASLPAQSCSDRADIAALMRARCRSAKRSPSAASSACREAKCR